MSQPESIQEVQGPPLSIGRTVNPLIRQVNSLRPSGGGIVGVEVGAQGASVYYNGPDITPSAPVFWGVIVDTDPNGDASTLTDNEYWVREAIINSSNTFVAATNGRWVKAYSVSGSSTRLAEDSDVVVRVHQVTDSVYVFTREANEPSSGQVLKLRKVITSSATITIPSTDTPSNVLIHAIGAGGGGGGGGDAVLDDFETNTGSTYSMNKGGTGGQGGGGGAEIKAMLADDSDIGLSLSGLVLTITAGSAGSGGAAKTDGSDGGDTTVSFPIGSETATLTAEGGAGGQNGEDAMDGSGFTPYPVKTIATPTLSITDGSDTLGSDSWYVLSNGRPGQPGSMGTLGGGVSNSLGAYIAGEGGLGGITTFLTPDQYQVVGGSATSGFLDFGGKGGDGGRGQGQGASSSIAGSDGLKGVVLIYY